MIPAYSMVAGDKAVVVAGVSRCCNRITRPLEASYRAANNYRRIRLQQFADLAGAECAGRHAWFRRHTSGNGRSPCHYSTA
jgi:hypothetical protein